MKEQSRRSATTGSKLPGLAEDRILIDGSPIPPWARWFISLGRQMAHPEENRCTWVCVTVPDRRFAAGLAALGAVLESPVSPHEERSAAERLAELSPGDWFTFIDANGQLRCGQFEGLVRGVLSYSRWTHSGMDSRKKLVDFCQSVWPLAANERPFAGPKDATENAAFVEAVFGASVTECLVRSTSDVTIVGVSTVIEAELNTQAFAICGAGGALLDIVRPRELLPSHERSRSRVLPSVSPPGEVDGLRTPFAIFDGPQAYLRLRDSLHACTNLIILDRWAPRAEDAVMAVRLEEAHSGLERLQMATPQTPPGIEVFAWTSAT